MALHRSIGWTVLFLLVLTMVLAPFAAIGPAIEAWASSQIDRFSEHRGLVALSVTALLAADVLLPIPSSVVATGSGALLGLALGITATFVGMSLGCVIGYGLGRWAGRPTARGLVGSAEVERLEALTTRYGDWALVVTRAVPVLAEASTVFAGLGGMRVIRFALVTGLANLGIAAVYAVVGIYAVRYESFLLAFFGAIAVPALAATLARLAHRRQRPPGR